MEARMLMLAPNNIFSPSSGKPITTPSQDITLGCYYLTQNPRGQNKDGQRFPLFVDAAEVEFAMAEGTIHTHDRIRIKNPDFGSKTIYGNAEAKVIETTQSPTRTSPRRASGMSRNAKGATNHSGP